MKGVKKIIIGLSTLGLLTSLSPSAFASGYRLEFQSPSTLADAGNAAVINDASTNFYNSAGLVYLPPQIVGSLIDLQTNTSFTGTTTPGLLGPGITMSGTAHSSPNSMLPAYHVSFPLSERLALGLSVVPTWGLSEFYGNDSIARYSLINVGTKTIDIAPSVAYKLNNQWSFGAGPDFNYFQIWSKTNSFTAPFGTMGDGFARYSAEDWNTGYHLGALFRMNDTTRFGINYRSKIVMNVEGWSSFYANGGIINGLSTNNLFSVNFPMPAVTEFSAYHDMSPVWALMGTIAWDQWSVLNTYHGNNYAQPVGFTPSMILVNLPQNMHDTIDLSVGTHYILNDKWLLRGSFKYEPSPLSNAYRSLANPDAPKYGINLGARYTLSKKIAFDFVYAHVFTPSVSVNDLNPVTGATAIGTSRTRLDLVGASVVWNFA